MGRGRIYLKTIDLLRYAAHLLDPCWRLSYSSFWDLAKNWQFCWVITSIFNIIHWAYLVHIILHILGVYWAYVRHFFGIVWVHHGHFHFFGHIWAHLLNIWKRPPTLNYRLLSRSQLLHHLAHPLCQFLKEEGWILTKIKEGEGSELKHFVTEGTNLIIHWFCHWWGYIAIHTAEVCSNRSASGH